MTALIWERGNYAGSTGYLPVGEKRIRIAATGWSTVRHDPLPWILKTDLPGFRKEGWKFAEEDEAKAKADQLLKAFGTWIATALDLSETAP